MKLVLNKIDNLDNFLNSINRCDDTVNMELPDGGSVDINSGFGQYLFAQEIFNNSSVKEVELNAKSDDDAEWLNRLYGGKSGGRSGFMGLF